MIGPIERIESALRQANAKVGCQDGRFHHTVQVALSELPGLRKQALDLAAAVSERDALRNFKAKVDTPPIEASMIISLWDRIRRGLGMFSGDGGVDGIAALRELEVATFKLFAQRMDVQ